MITGHVFIATSVDGFIARENGNIDWLHEIDTKNEDHGYVQFMQNIDAIIMGRGTFETLSTIRPWVYDIPTIVLSKTLADQPTPTDLIGKVRFVNKTPKEAMALLENEGCQRVYVDGGRVVQSFIYDALITDLIITQIPLLLGNGRRLFGDIPNEIFLQHQNTKTFPSGFVQSKYIIKR